MSCPTPHNRRCAKPSCKAFIYCRSCAPHRPSNRGRNGGYCDQCLPWPAQPTPELAAEMRSEAEARELEDAFRSFALRFRLAGESEAAAVDRVRRAPYLVLAAAEPESDAFFMCTTEWDKVILTLNTNHVFWRTVLGPLEQQARASDPQLARIASNALRGVHAQLFGLASAQSAMTANDGELRAIFDRLRRQWGANVADHLGS